MQSVSEETRERLAFLRSKLAKLREEYIFVGREYREGKLSLDDEIAHLANLNRQVYVIVAETIAIIRPAALS